MKLSMFAILLLALIVGLSGCSTSHEIFSEDGTLITIVDLAKVGEYKISVDYNLTLEQMIAAGKYDAIIDYYESGDDIVKQFPLADGKGKKEIILEAIEFGSGVTSKEALDSMDKGGFRPATIEELLAFGAAFPDVQKKEDLWIVALGSAPVIDKKRLVAYLGKASARNGSGRVLGLHNFDDGWGGRKYNWFLVVAKPVELTETNKPNQ